MDGFALHEGHQLISIVGHFLYPFITATRELLNEMNIYILHDGNVDGVHCVMRYFSVSTYHTYIYYA